MAANSEITSRIAIANRGSVNINIPSEMARALEIEAGDAVMFRYDDENKRLILADHVDGLLTD